MGGYRGRPSLLARAQPATARCFFLATVAVGAVDGLLLAGWHQEANYLVLSAMVSACAGLAALARPNQDAAFGCKVIATRRAEALSTFAVFIFFLALYSATANISPSPFNAHVRQAFALIHGHTYINAPKYIEHAHFESHDYELHPPLPALILIPAVWLWGMRTNQTVFSIIVGALDVALAWRMLGKFNLTLNARTWLALFFGAGTILWSETINGGSWGVSMTVAVLFTLAALDELFGSGRAALVGFYAGLAALARYDLAFVWPIYLVLPYIKDRRGPFFAVKVEDIRRVAVALPGMLFATAIFAVFNEARYHSLFDQGVFIFASATHQHLFSLEYLPGNLYTLLFMAPSVSGRFPYLHLNFAGQCLLFTSPAFLLALRPSYARPVNGLIGLAALVSMMPSLLYWTNGFAQFGTRHYLHAFPFLLVLMALGTPRRIDRLGRTLIACSIALIAFGVWYVRVYGL